MNLDVDELKNKQREDVFQLLCEYSRGHQKKAYETLAEVPRRVEKIFGIQAGQEATTGGTLARSASSNGALASLADWLKQTLKCEVSPDELGDLDRDGLEHRLETAVEDRFRPEIRRMERSVVLQLLDTAWKDHLLAMDHLRSSVGLRGYAQVDPKVEYKREGMRTFEVMWTSVGERVTDLVFRMEQLDESFVGSTWVETSARHEEMPSTSEIAQQQQAAIDGMQSDHKTEPIRNRDQKVGRNDPCPCGSGKKFKNCHMRQGSGMM